MPDKNSESPEQSPAKTSGGGAFWLTDPERGMLLPLSGIWILALDWLLFSSNVLSAGIATPAVVVLGFLLGGAGTLVLQKWVAGDSLWKASSKALVAGVVVGVPWPLFGTVLGGWILLAAGLNKSTRGASKK